MLSSIIASFMISTSVVWMKRDLAVEMDEVELFTAAALRKEDVPWSVVKMAAFAFMTACGFLMFSVVNLLA